MARSVAFWWKALRTVQMVGMQAERFDIALQQLERAEHDASDRARLSAETELNLALRATRDAEPFARWPVRTPTWALEWMMLNEQDLLVVAVRDLFRALDGLPKDKRPRLIQQHQLTLLRNLTEHWEEEEGQSVKKMRDRYPEFRPGWITANMREVWIGGKDGGVLLSDIWTWAGQMQEAVEAQLIALGEEVPDLARSSIAGDDDLTWPSQRIAFHWLLPAPPEDTWPRISTPFVGGETNEAFRDDEWFR